MATPLVIFGRWTCHPKFQTYAQGGTCINLVDVEDGSPIATATAWIPGLAPAEVAIKDYSENEGMYDALIAADVIEPAHRYLPSGWGQFPICILKQPK